MSGCEARLPEPEQFEKLNRQTAGPRHQSFGNRPAVLPPTTFRQNDVRGFMAIRPPAVDEQREQEVWGRLPWTVSNQLKEVRPTRGTSRGVAEVVPWYRAPAPNACASGQQSVPWTASDRGPLSAPVDEPVT
jgi:hypothetical protein